LGISP